MSNNFKEALDDPQHPKELVRRLVDEINFFCLELREAQATPQKHVWSKPTELEEIEDVFFEDDNSIYHFLDEDSLRYSLFTSRESQLAYECRNLSL